MDISRSALKSGVWYTVCNFLVKSLGFISTPIFTRLLTQTDFGLYNNYTSWISLFSVFITLNLEASLISAKHDFEKDFDKYVYSLAILTVLLGLFWISIINIVHTQFSSLTNIEPIYLNSMVLYIVSTAGINLYQAKERYNYGYKKTVFVSFIFAFSSTLLSIALVGTMGNKLMGRVLGTTIPSIFIGTAVITFLRTELSTKIFDYWKYAVIICLPYIPHILAGSVLGSMDRIMIQNFWGAESTALYSLAYNCGTIVTMLTLSVNAAYSPWLSDKLNIGDFKLISKISKVYAGIFMFIVIGIMLIAPEVLYILGGSNYMESKYVITPVTMGCACQFIYTMYVNIEQIEKKTTGMACATIVAATINYILNFIFIPKIGYLAAAYTTLIGYICLLIIHIIVVKKLGMGKLYDNKYMIILVLIGCFIMCMINITYSNNVLRYVIVSVYSILCFCILFKHRKMIKNYFERRNSNV